EALDQLAERGSVAGASAIDKRNDISPGHDVDLLIPARRVDRTLRVRNALPRRRGPEPAIACGNMPIGRTFGTRSVPSTLVNRGAVGKTATALRPATDRKR